MTRHETDPLLDFELFRTRDPLKAQEQAMLITSPHRLQVSGRLADFSAAFQSVQVKPVTVGVVRYGAEITIDRPGFDGSVSALVPISGALSVEQRGREYVATPGRSMVVFSPGHGAMRLRWIPHTVVMALKADTEELSRALHWIAPQAGEQPFRATSPLTTGLGPNSVLGTIHHFAEVFSRFGPNHTMPLPLARHLREQALSTIWLSVPNNHTDVIYSTDQPTSGSRVRQVIDLIATESQAVYTVPDLARAVNVGVRSLELAFRRELDETPLHYLQRVRMERAHEDLRDYDPPRITVTEIAHRWGFGHLGRFAARYRARFGEMPGETLARAGR
ncbi:helix-turn-helix transcriptional regulator [Streptomyces sp. NRRL F-5126]|uniref:helix-turn-helix transcriptional regulator n=1 Tax=Streptomyces sp. NRRL F-5126 TaxID=1463857 RepID=UPI0006911AAE|nr:AraC family transcriptional regulator [Streptomyces sp. NRRL F-5126]